MKPKTENARPARKKTTPEQAAARKRMTAQRRQIALGEAVEWAIQLAGCVSHAEPAVIFRKAVELAAFERDFRSGFFALLDGGTPPHLALATAVDIAQGAALRRANPDAESLRELMKSAQSMLSEAAEKVPPEDRVALRELLVGALDKLDGMPPAAPVAAGAN